MLTALRKFFGFVALVWLGCVALALVMFTISAATGTNPRSRVSPAHSQSIQGTGALFLFAYFASPVGILCCLVWFGLKRVQASGQGKHARRKSRGLHPVQPHYMDYARWFVQKNGEPVFAQGKHVGRSLRGVARKDPEYLRWMLGEEIPHDTKSIVADALEREQQPIERRAVLRRDDGPLAVPLEAEVPPPLQSPEVFTYEAPGINLCPSCGDRPALFYCKSHQAPLCLNCVGGHDSPSECSYIPAWRKEAAFAGLPQPAHTSYSYEAPTLPKCPQCKRRPALFYCLAHSLSVCLNCLGSHDVASECSYMPEYRAENSDDKGASTEVSRRVQIKPKTGSVFGIS